MIRSDSHVHTSFSTDSDTPMEMMLQAARDKGLHSVCFTDHMDYGYPGQEKEPVFLFEPADYFLELQRLQSVSALPDIRFGIELGLRPDITKRCRKLTDEWPFDFVIGSTHMVDGWDPYYPEYWEGRTEREGLRRYYEATLENLQSGFNFDVYGHIDYIIRYTPTQKEYRSRGVLCEEYMDSVLASSFDIIDEILRILIQSGRGIEINTAGLKYGLGHPNPHERILKRYRELGGELLSVGSDAHRPEHLAYEFDKVPELLLSCGFRYYTEYRQRKPEQIAL